MHAWPATYTTTAALLGNFVDSHALLH